ncbi:hypothetical protein F4779DRAFT_236912 [Xylariaceae sp. FL0662B]|nr:hypothetical protein F4779DRAFT_236912 [Xylariaceae sp. FL0662B]
MVGKPSGRRKLSAVGTAVRLALLVTNQQTSVLLVLAGRWAWNAESNRQLVKSQKGHGGRVKVRSPLEGVFLITLYVCTLGVRQPTGFVLFALYDPHRSFLVCETREGRYGGDVSTARAVICDESCQHLCVSRASNGIEGISLDMGTLSRSCAYRPIIVAEMCIRLPRTTRRVPWAKLRSSLCDESRRK